MPMRSLFLSGTMLAVMLFSSRMAEGAPLHGEKSTATHADGTAFEVRLWGDEFFAISETPEGYTVVRDAASGDWFYAVVGDSGMLEPGTLRVGASDPATAGIPQHVRPDRHVMAAKASHIRKVRTEIVQRSYAEARMRSGRGLANPQEASGGVWSTTGTRTGITIIIDFKDQTTNYTTADIDRLLNDDGYTEYGNNGSVKAYFSDISRNRLQYTNKVVGPFVAPENKDYYKVMDWNASIQAYLPIRTADLVQQALNWAEGAGFDFSSCDGNKDGVIDAVSLFYAGARPAYIETLNGLWPHQWALYSQLGHSFAADGVSASFYQITNLGTSLSIATYAHESMHMLTNCYDLYDYNYISDGVGKFCIMAYTHTETNPQRVCAYLRYRCGWLDPVDITSETGGSRTLNSDTGNALIYKKSATEYFIIENRQATGRDSGLPDSGILVLHADHDGSNDFSQMTSNYHYECSVEQADGKFDLEKKVGVGGDSGDLFAAAFGIFSDTSTPNAKWWNDTSSSLRLSVSGSVGTAMIVNTGTKAGTNGDGGDDSGDDDDDGGGGSGSDWSNYKPGEDDPGPTPDTVPDPAPSMKLTLAMTPDVGGLTYPGSTVAAIVEFNPDGYGFPVDLYATIALPDGTTFWCDAAGGLHLQPVPYRDNVVSAAVMRERFFSLTLPAGLPQGVYLWTVMAVDRFYDPTVAANQLCTEIATMPHTH